MAQRTPRQMWRIKRCLQNRLLGKHIARCGLNSSGFCYAASRILRLELDEPHHLGLTYHLGGVLDPACWMGKLSLPSAEPSHPANLPSSPGCYTSIHLNIDVRSILRPTFLALTNSLTASPSSAASSTSPSSSKSPNNSNSSTVTMPSGQVCTSSRCSAHVPSAPS